jgi:hypothetical protein
LDRPCANFVDVGVRAVDPDQSPCMNKTIWTCWLQGRESAPPLVQICLSSWERNNPGWTVRCLDATSIERYVPLHEHIDLNRQSLTAASLSDVIRIQLLHEFGGVWVDATLFCVRPLDEWLPSVMDAGFFAFAAPEPGRPLSSWFLSAESGSYLVSRWWQSTIDYWATRDRSGDYYWFHNLFRDLCSADPKAAEAWAAVPPISADGPHALQAYLYEEMAVALREVDWNTPVFKLTHRLRPGAAPKNSTLEAILEDFHHDGATPANTPAPVVATAASVPPTSFAALSVSTENLGDHIQILAGTRLLSRLGIEPTRLIDRDDEIRSAPGLDQQEGTVGILLNGWFKTNPAEWPPHPSLVPIVDGFHIRLFQCPELVSEESLAFFRQFQPIGCRDRYTEALLRSHGIEAFTSNCLSLTLNDRIDDPSRQTETFVVSRDERIKDVLPESLGPYCFVSHYSGSTDFAENVRLAESLLEMYRTRAKVVVTTLLHCALPAIAMGIPVVVFYPINTGIAHESDLERFSALDGICPVYSLDEMDNVDWNPRPIDVARIKLDSLDRFYAMAGRWQLPPPPPIGPIAPSSALPPPDMAA